MSEKTDEWVGLIHDNLRMARRNAGYSQEKAADILGFAQSTIGQVEAGRRRFPSFYLFFLLCELYGVSPEEMFRGRIEPKLSVEKKIRGKMNYERIGEV